MATNGKCTTPPRRLRARIASMGERDRQALACAAFFVSLEAAVAALVMLGWFG